MNAVEFSGIIKKGQITVPQQYIDYDNSNVRIIMLIEEKKDSKKENLLNVFNKMKSQNMFSSIENPVLWQKQIRDEWE